MDFLFLLLVLAVFLPLAVVLAPLWLLLRLVLRVLRGPRF